MQLCAAANGAVLAAAGSPDDSTTRRRFGEYRIECVTADPRAPDRTFCGTFDAGVFRMTNGGVSWHAIGTDALPESVTSLAVSPAAPDVAYAGTEPSAVFRSRDDGGTWAELAPLSALDSAPSWAFPSHSHTHYVYWIEPDPTDVDRLFVAVEAGALVRSFDGGETWQDRVASNKRDTHSMATHLDRPSRVWVVAGDGHAETDDAGETWTTPTAGFGHGYCQSVAIDPADPESVLLTAASGPIRAHRVELAAAYLYRRRDSLDDEGDGDESWDRLDKTGLSTRSGATRVILTAGRTGGECYVANDRGLYRTTNFGDSWDRIEVPWDGTRRTAAGLVVVA